MPRLLRRLKQRMMRPVFGVVLLIEPRDPLWLRVARSLVLLLVFAALMVSCTPMRYGGTDSRMPPWRRPGPAADGPIERRIIPDDGFQENLAASPGPPRAATSA